MKIIDAHIHYSNIRSFHDTATELSKVDYSFNGIQKEFKDNNVVLGIAMGVTEKAGEGFPDSASPTPMGIDLTEEIPNNIVYCAGINPFRLDEAALLQVEKDVQKPECVGIKIYLGYYPFYAYDDVYEPVYKIAKKYNVPVVYHTGDTYSERGRLRFSHPLAIDEVAVKHRNMTIMMAHFGDPWVLDAAEVVYKNSNVYADLSGLVVGADGEIKRLQETRFFDHLLHALTFTNNYEKFLFGTDWPLTPIKPYIEFIQDIIPKAYHEDVFYNTAINVFPKIKSLLK
ncbi:amidohydrolase family protein [Fredinandcohnia quinoae]|uniref:Amidohydrolase family protein n=1 Tax=Fredinandcohnia quinoae TaxID=2918902 RepID=A0AAW5E3R3_9BACI|nr:TatD family hydrolase [Fredinandcohnia sp. SECRCQ15]MCH1627113.1 amidohydrolase family protein [Fredinandcohnia sp. SECRCQ15]